MHIWKKLLVSILLVHAWLPIQAMKKKDPLVIYDKTEWYCPGLLALHKNFLMPNESTGGLARIIDVSDIRNPKVIKIKEQTIEYFFTAQNRPYILSFENETPTLGIGACLKLCAYSDDMMRIISKQEKKGFPAEIVIDGLVFNECGDFATFLPKAKVLKVCSIGKGAKEGQFTIVCKKKFTMKGVGEDDEIKVIWLTRDGVIVFAALHKQLKTVEHLYVVDSSNKKRSIKMECRYKPSTFLQSICCFSQDEKVFAYIYDHNVIHIMECEKSICTKRIQSIVLKNETVCSFDMGPQGRLVYIGTNKGTVRVFDRRNNRFIKTLRTGVVQEKDLKIKTVKVSGKRVFATYHPYNSQCSKIVCWEL